jgi:hypothetical protein
MKTKIVVSMVVVALLLVGIMATSVLASNTTLAKNTDASKELRANDVSVKPNGAVSVQEVSPAALIPPKDEELPENDVTDETDDLKRIDVDALRESVPGTYEEVDSLVCKRVRFLLYTHDGKHIMWGFVGDGYFVGKDNLGKRCWGIYGKGVFAGFYDGEFFWGRYRGGNWKAMGLFGENYAHGKYILFPTTNITPEITATYP